MSYRRDLQPFLAERASRAPVVVLTGPRQSGKTTLCRAVFPNHSYLSLERPDLAARAQNDPLGFLADAEQNAAGVVLDEVQKVPELISYVQVASDEGPRPGRFVLTGSQNFALAAAISQSLAGRAALLELLPLSVGELRQAGLLPDDPWAAIFQGGYPAIFDRGEPATDWLGSYVATYLERDVRQIIKVQDLIAFRTFLGLAASRTGSLLNFSQLGSDAGVTHATARAWLSLLEASYVAIRLPPFARNIGKRLIKTPKLHFLDSGLVCFLLGIRSPDELRHHPLRGPIFESWVVAEAGKALRNQGAPTDLAFFRDAGGHEIDLLVGAVTPRLAVEVKSGATLPPESFTPLAKASKEVALGAPPARFIVHAGRERITHAGAVGVPWWDVSSIPWSGAPS